MKEKSNICGKGKARMGAALAVISLAGFMLSPIGIVPAASQNSEPIYIAPLFEYPVAPDDLPDLQSRSDYLMTHFWDSLDFRTPRPVDQNALNDAFRAYMGPAPYASRAAVLASVEEVVKNLKGNSALTLQFAKAAEENLYGRRASFWSDEVYIPFLRAALADKKIPEVRKLRYSEQLKIIQSNAIGKKFPKLRMTLRDGRHHDFTAKAPYTIVEFGNPDCEDCQFAKMKLEMASDLSDWVAAKEVEVVFIVPDAVPEDQASILELFKDYPEAWTVGISYGADDIFDLRATPDFYVLSRNGRIEGKNLDASGALERLRTLKEAK